MANQHAKCPRCRGRGTRWGQRRRCCPRCLTTWRIRKKKRGRKPLRHTPQRARAYLAQREHLPTKYSYRTLCNRRTVSNSALCVQLPWPAYPSAGPCILIADAFLQCIEHAWYTWYCILVRPVEGDDAIILKPFCRRGTEVARVWQEAFGSVPEELMERTVALVSDGHTGLILEARRRGWRIQRCHFHLIARLQQKRSPWRRGFHTAEGKRLSRLATVCLATRSKRVLDHSLRALAVLRDRTTSRDVRRMLSGFFANYEDYRTYLHYPELRLPVTSNTAEALIGLIRELCHRAHGFRTVRSMNSWIEALVKVRKSIKCRKKNQPN